MNINLNGLQIDATRYAVTGSAILGIRDSGKTYAATVIAEQLLDAKIPFVVFDPIGVWRNLKVPGRGKGYPVVVAHASTGDVKLTPGNAQEIVRAAMRENIPLVIDLFDADLSKADWRRIVETSVKVLLHENKQHGVRHIFIEEAAEFCPQNVRPEDGKVFDMIERLARMGGNASLGYTLINQRAEQVNKAVLELCDYLFLFRQKGRNSLTALGKWLDFSNPAASKEIIAGLPMLETGRCWGWVQGADRPVAVKIPVKNSFHPNRQNPMPAKSTRGMDVTSFVAQLQKSLVVQEEKVKADDPVELRKQIAALKKQVTTLAPEKVRVEVPVLTKAQEKIMNGIGVALMEADANIKGMVEIWQGLEGQVNKLRVDLAKLANPLIEVNPVAMRGLANHIYRETTKLPGPRVTIQMPVDEVQKANGGLGKCARELLRAIAQCGDEGGDKGKVAIMAGYSLRSSGFSNALSELRTAGLITPGQPMVMTDEGANALGGKYSPLPTGKDLLDHWLSSARIGTCEKTLLQRIYHAPAGITKEQLSAGSGYSLNSSGFSNALSRLRVLGLIQRGEPIKAAEVFYQ